VSVGDEAFVWGIVENYCLGIDKCMWGGPHWLARFTKWGNYINECREDPEYTAIEKAALVVRDSGSVSAFASRS